ncbi:MAG: IS5/IS1182 family transposase, partial [Methanothrix sp.]|nr:IS5/IS1182 family transposase [Methanothrix sp.]
MTYEDNRDWPKYNEILVKRGEFYLDMNCVNN